ncbi:MAG TPA: cysteine desulfurase family protein [Myxococcota bacterium]|nr:cysteine desulfurase family protein [Myxococcota bacterium]HQK51248.1 cysteine desulfurase family protein [Myxococcota bacterium]
MIYLDHGSTTPLAPEVAEAMARATAVAWGNPSSDHGSGLAAARVLEEARLRVATALRADPAEVVFTSGGTEANNLALKGRLLRGGRPGGRLVVSAIEHPSVMACAAWLEGLGVAVDRLPVDGEGLVDPDDLRRRLRPDTRLVSVGHGNHEIGTVQPLAELARVCAEAGVPFHTDACQSFTREPLPAPPDLPDLVSVNAHKIHGPKGAGALRVRRGLALEPLMHGGPQEGGLRPGTQNVPALAGFGVAVSLADPAEYQRQAALRDRLLERLLSIRGAHLHGSRTRRLCHHLSLRFDGVSGRALAAALDRAGVRVSRGSACSSGTTAPSPVLLALGIPPAEALGAVRITLGRGTTEAEVDQAGAIIDQAVATLRRTP